jgi:hypothetical protein
MSADDRDVRLEELLRTSLYDEAETIVPAGDGLSRIQSRVVTRRTRAAWWQPMAVLGGVAVVAVAGFAAYALTRSPNPPSSIKSTNVGENQTPTPQPTTPTPSTPAVAKVTFPATAFYPFTSQVAEQQWEMQDGPTKQPWVLDPKLEAKMFVAAFLQQPGVDQDFGSHVSGRTANVTLGRTMHDGGRAIPVKVTTIQLARFGKAWLVVGASDPNTELRLTTPRSGQTVTSPAVVSGPGYGVDENVRIDVRTVSGVARTGDRPTAAFGNGVPQWSVTVPFTPTDSRGAVVVDEPSAADGGPGRIIAVGVNFATVQTASYPKYFYGVKEGRVTKFSSRTGAAISYLTAPGGASDPQLVGNQVFYLDGVGACVNALRSVPVGGGKPTTVATPDTGYFITGFGVLGTDTRINTYFESACDSAIAPQGRLVFNTIVGDTHTQQTSVDFPSLPPEVTGDPSWSTDQQHVIAVVRTGTKAEVRSYDAYGSDANPTLPCGNDASFGLPTATQVDSTGAVWFAVQQGSGMQVLRCAGGQSSVAFSVTGTDTPQDLAVADNGQAVLLTDTSGALWRWTAGSSTVTQVYPSYPQHDISW